MICKYSGAMKNKYKKQFLHLSTLQTSTAILRFANIKEDGDMLKIFSGGKPLEKELMVDDKCYKEYTCLPKDKTARCPKFHIKNAITKS